MNRINIPNLITGLRILLIPVLVVVFYTAPLDWRYLASAIVFTVAAITDWLDGYLARKMGQMTPFGAFLDPVADKLIVATSLVLLVEVHASAILAGNGWLTIASVEVWRFRFLGRSKPCSK